MFYDKLTFIYLEMPKFKKSLEELKTRFDKWLYVIRNLNRREIVINGLKQGLDKKVIAALTGLSVEEIEKIAENEIGGKPRFDLRIDFVKKQVYSHYDTKFKRCR